ncbi:MAG: hypothetical protein F4Y82_04090 [Cenarchaeum sp. SB0665_bin_23]|nr:hypothetical protein [Cenarchaeum sp. SB0667_bin_13]MXY61279.1 hypothetical protein [Cenarchaeum sp. SB0665_bin_23]MXZ93122.1 hypothetical protein [Cenarchaeum sp. SB0666_bin_15]MYB46752.1 hypothetical protein [Cenarchaeum sp. SB0662_bin_33]MYC79071.1 hypothetical protein [Cenarchaeum sp. SB0661_bin_35]MYD58588.1 hypothetical protein [Cenarchaeum sp. SB0678_bin_8]MYG32767.1 hypothetical protein [Cenarchaeum sp. SB0677_bin_16]MYI51629.1 hypothetical protein [Cenarchaeum sp. SB0673_bin_9]M
MAHSEHNRARNKGGFALVILGALLLFLAPTIYPSIPTMGIASLAAGFVVGGFGFYIHFLRYRRRSL